MPEPRVTRCPVPVAAIHRAEAKECMIGDTVINPKTTGSSPSSKSRSCSFLSERGDIEEQRSTLLDRQRDFGPTRILSTSARDDRCVPPALRGDRPYVPRSITDRTIAAHNASFGPLPRGRAATRRSVARRRAVARTPNDAVVADVPGRLDGRQVRSSSMLPRRHVTRETPISPCHHRQRLTPPTRAPRRASS